MQLNIGYFLFRIGHCPLSIEEYLTIQDPRHECRGSILKTGVLSSLRNRVEFSFLEGVDLLGEGAGLDGGKGLVHFKEASIQEVEGSKDFGFGEAGGHGASPFGLAVVSQNHVLKKKGRIIRYTDGAGGLANAHGSKLDVPKELPRDGVAGDEAQRIAGHFFQFPDVVQDNAGVEKVGLERGIGRDNAFGCAQHGGDVMEESADFGVVHLLSGREAEKGLGNVLDQGLGERADVRVGHGGESIAHFRKHVLRVFGGTGENIIEGELIARLNRPKSLRIELQLNLLVKEFALTGKLDERPNGKDLLGRDIPAIGADRARTILKGVGGERFARGGGFGLGGVDASEADILGPRGDIMNASRRHGKERTVEGLVIQGLFFGLSDDLMDALPRDAKDVARFLEGVFTVAHEAEFILQNLAIPFGDGRQIGLDASTRRLGAGALLWVEVGEVRIGGEGLRRGILGGGCFHAIIVQR